MVLVVAVVDQVNGLDLAEAGGAAVVPLVDLVQVLVVVLATVVLVDRQMELLVLMVKEVAVVPLVMVFTHIMEQLQTQVVMVS
jgi:hypothetical protein